MVGTLLVFSPFDPRGEEDVPRAFADSGEGSAGANGGSGKLRSGDQRMVHDGLFPSDVPFRRPIGAAGRPGRQDAGNLAAQAAVRSPVRGVPGVQTAASAERNRVGSAGGGAAGAGPRAPASWGNSSSDTWPVHPFSTLAGSMPMPPRSAADDGSALTGVFNSGTAPSATHQSSSIFAGMGHGQPLSAPPSSTAPTFSLQPAGQTPRSPATGPAKIATPASLPTAPESDAVDSGMGPGPVPPAADEFPPARAEVPDTTKGFTLTRLELSTIQRFGTESQTDWLFQGVVDADVPERLTIEIRVDFYQAGPDGAPSPGASTNVDKATDGARLLGSTTAMKDGAQPGPVDLKGVVAAKLEEGSPIFAIASGSQVDAAWISAPLQVSEAGKSAGDADPDGDGVPEAIEALAPSLPSDASSSADLGPDWARSDLVAVPALADGAPYVTFSAPGLTLRSVHVLDRPDPAARAQLPLGLFGFEVHGVKPGGAATVRMVLPDGANPDRYYKLDPVTGALARFDFDGATGAEIAGNVVMLHLVDGGRGDADGLANGVIVDPGGPGSYVCQTIVDIMFVLDGSKSATRSAAGRQSWALSPDRPTSTVATMRSRA